MFNNRIGGALVAAAKLHADRPALVALGETLSYAQLFELASGIAADLRDAGLAGADRVALLSRRSRTLYAGVLGTLIAGGAYVPLNIRYPAERNQAILRASSARALILDQSCAADLAAYLGEVPEGVAVLMPEARASRASSSFEGLADAGNEGSARETAYILFTSGTTGAPKGVPISHANLAAYLDAISKIFTIGPEDRVLQAADLTFDQSVHDMFFTWLNGAALYSLRENAAVQIPRIIAQNTITACQLVPSTGVQTGQLGMLKAGSMPSLRISLFGGEALPVSVARAWSAAAPASRIINVYGPTECTVTFSTFEFEADQAGDYAVVPIGFPLRGGKMAVFDSDDASLPVGGTGEIYLSGPQVMTGYWRAPHLDAQKFVDIGGERWYRTGDLGRLIEPHGVVYAGRMDRQVKIRGYRVELQEIEGVLRQACDRDEAAVVAWPVRADGAADGAIAFVAGAAIDPAHVLARCRKKLPAYMTPSRIVFMDALPLNANGKVDHRALAETLRLAQSQGGESAPKSAGRST